MDEKDVSKEGKRSKSERKRAKEENGEGKYQKPNTEDEARKGDRNIVGTEMKRRLKEKKKRKEDNVE